MKFSTFVGLGAVVGLGAYAAHKLSKKSKDESEDVVYTAQTETVGDKVHKASMYAVGSVRTGIDKIAEGFKEISKEDIVKRGEETVDVIKNSATNLKKDITDLKDMVVSINTPESDEITEEFVEMTAAEENDAVQDLNKEFGVSDVMETGANGEFEDLEEI